LPLLRTAGARRHQLSVRGDLASLFHEEGQLEKARRGYEAVLVELRDIGDRRGEALFSALLAGAQAALGLVQLAEETLDEARACLADVDDPLYAAVLDVQEAQLDLARARAAEAGKDGAAGQRLRESALARLAEAEAPRDALGGRSRAQASEVVRVALRILKAALRVDGTAGEARYVLDARLHKLHHPFGVLSFARRRRLRELAYTLAEQANQVVSKERLVQRWLNAAYDEHRHDGALRVNVTRLRKVLAPCGFSIEAGPGGYLMRTPDGFRFEPG